MICPRCFSECDALKIDPELGLICKDCLYSIDHELFAEGTIPIVDDSDFDLPDYDYGGWR